MTNRKPKNQQKIHKPLAPPPLVVVVPPVPTLSRKISTSVAYLFVISVICVIFGVMSSNSHASVDTSHLSEAENPIANIISDDATKADETPTDEAVKPDDAQPHLSPPSAGPIDPRENTEETDPRWRELEAIFMSRYGITASGNPTAAIVAIDLKNPTTHLINVNAEATMHLASVYKVFVAYATYARIGEGSLSFDTRLATNQTVSYCLDRMLLFSENECAHALGDYLGWTNIENRVAGIGIKVNLHGYTTSTAQYLALFLQKLYNNQLLPTYLTDIFIGKLKVQVIRDRIAYALPNKIVADKPGNFDPVLNDIAIVFDTNRETADDYILVILTDGQSISEIVNIARLVDANFNPPLAE